MSFDVEVRTAKCSCPCPHCPRREYGEGVLSVRPAYDIGGIFRRCGVPIDEMRCNPQPVTNILPRLRLAYAYAIDRAHDAELRALEPDNGWGSLDGAIKMLNKVIHACEAEPDGTIQW